MSRKRKEFKREEVLPLVAAFLDFFEKSGLNLGEFCDHVGITRTTLFGWRRGVSPTLGNFQAALNSLGYDLEIKELEIDDKRIAARVRLQMQRKRNRDMHERRLAGRQLPF